MFEINPRHSIILRDIVCNELLTGTQIEVCKESFHLFKSNVCTATHLTVLTSINATNIFLKMGSGHFNLVYTPGVSLSVLAVNKCIM